MHISRNVYKAIGMEKEIEEMFDLLWKFSDDIRYTLCSELFSWTKTIGLMHHYAYYPNYSVYNLKKK